MSTATLDEIEAYLDALEHGLRSAEADALDIAEPRLDDTPVAAADEERARAVLERLQVLQERAEGQRVRIAGEIAGLRRRNANDGHRRGPQSFDSSF